MNIGIIGFGRFGKLAVKYLSEDFDVFVFSRKNKSKEINEIGGKPALLKEVCSKDVIIPSVPISQLENVLLDIKRYLKNNVLIADVCSVKVYPVEVMLRILPKNIQVLGTHPIFGPDSASDSLKGRKIVLCKARVDNEKYESVKNYLMKKGLKIIEISPEEHDKQIAKSLFLTHFIGRGLLDYGVGKLDIDTEGYKRLLSILATVENDTWQLFYDMYNYNKYSKEIAKKFLDSLRNVDKRLRR